jgi:NAD(P)-dependent dehydrogenase (short-subunit alcohol dehydrogenase family)
MSLAGRIAVVTGAGSGLGRAGALALAAAGARVAVSDLRSETAEDTAGAIRAAGGEAIAIAADAGDRVQAKHLIDETVARFGGLDVLYNNAGVAPIGRDGFTPAIDEDDWDWVIRTNLTSVYLCCKYAIPVMAGRPGAAIVNTASSMAVQPLGMMDAYAASKAGVAGLTRSLAPACGQLGIRVNAICPGYVDTPMNALIFGDETFKAAFARDHATGLQTVDEIAEIVVFLASDASRAFTGAVLTCDRGWTAFKRPGALGTM